MFRLARSSSLTRRRAVSTANGSSATRVPIQNGRRLLMTGFEQESRRTFVKLPKKTGKPGAGIGGGWWVPSIVGLGAGWYLKTTHENFKDFTNPAKDINYQQLKTLITSDESSGGSGEIRLTESPEYIEDTDASDDLVAPVIDNTPQEIVSDSPETVAPVEQSSEGEPAEAAPSEAAPAEVTPVEEEVPVLEESVSEESVPVSQSVEVTPESTKVSTLDDAENAESTEERPDVDLSPLQEPEDPAAHQVECDPHSLPEFVPYLIVGGGAASFAAMRAITAGDPGTKVLIVTDEEYAPYQRPPLSKEFWQGDAELAAQTLRFKNWGGTDRSVYMDEDWHFAAPGELMHYECTKVGLACNSKVSHLDTESKTAILSDGRTVKYGKCLVAIGGKPKKVPELANLENVTYYRHLNDFKKLEKQCREEFRGKKIAVIGGGFLGSELAVALGGKSEECGFTVDQIIKETGNLGFILPDYLSRWTKEKVDKCNVTVTSEAKVVKSSQGEDGKITLELSNGNTMECDHVVAAVGLEIDRNFAEKSNIEWDEKRGGMVVNSELQATRDVWIAGDATSFHDKKLGRRRVEHHDHAIVTGRLAGSNMVHEEQTSYWHQSMYWSDLGPEVGFEAIGLTDCKTLKTVGVFNKATDADTPRARDVDADSNATVVNTEGAAASKDYGKGVVFYLNKNDRVVGVVSWNLFGKMKRARKIISDEIIVQSEDDLDELAKLFFPKKKVPKVAPPAPVVEAPVAEPPIAAAPIAEATVAETPVVETPVVEAPITETPVVPAATVETPVVEAPISETPVVEAPAAPEPVVETVVEAAPVEQAPVEQAPIAQAPEEQAPVVESAPIEESSVADSISADVASAEPETCAVEVPAPVSLEAEVIPAPEAAAEVVPVIEKIPEKVSIVEVVQEVLNESPPSPQEQVVDTSTETVEPKVLAETIPAPAEEIATIPEASPAPEAPVAQVVEPVTPAAEPLPEQSNPVSKITDHAPVVTEQAPQIADQTPEIVEQATELIGNPAAETIAPAAQPTLEESLNETADPVATAIQEAEALEPVSQTIEQAVTDAVATPIASETSKTPDNKKSQNESEKNNKKSTASAEKLKLDSDNSETTPKVQE